MTVQSDAAEARKAAIDEILSKIRPILDASTDVSSMNQAKEHLMALCERSDLFNFEAFPIPEGATEGFYLIHEDEDGRYALYVNAGLPGQTSKPHDHAGHWAIVAAVQGEETHRLFERDETRTPPIRHMGTLTVKPGQAVSMRPDGIHAISADGADPLLHLHFYGLAFDRQRGRREYDEETGEELYFEVPDVGEILDAR
jgi:predicted metal-dependent enzyme (double-stranded beta helix superfamily)